MTLTEVLVSASLFLGVCSGAAQMGAGTTRAMTASRERAAVLEQIEAQFLAVAPVIHAGVTVSSSCGAAAIAMQQQLEVALPPLGTGVQRQLSLVAGGEQVLIAFTGPGGVRRQRLLTPAAYGLCPVAGAADALR